MWPNPQFTANFVKFTEGILNEKLHNLCSDLYKIILKSPLEYAQNMFKRQFTRMEHY